MITETLAPADAVQLAVVTRSGFVESRHVGAAVVLEPGGTVAHAWGSAGAVILPRSAEKPLLTVGMLSSGVSLDPTETALATGSHAGTARHAAAVATMLQRVQAAPDDLLCPEDWPLSSSARDEQAQRGLGPSKLTNTCSGKHAAMVLSCHRNGWDPATYTDIEHPLQVHVREVVERLTGEKAALTAVDGCGAPVHGMRLTALARGIQRIATADAASSFVLFRAAARVRTSVLAQPWALDGTGRANTAVVEKLGVFAKWGAEGVAVVASPEGATAAVKVLDGGYRAALVVALTALVKAKALPGADVARVLGDLPLDVRGGGRSVGAVVPTLA